MSTMAHKYTPLKNWSDPNARHQIINQIIIEEYVNACKEKRRNWIGTVQKRLQHYGIEISRGCISCYCRELKTGIREASVTSSFGGNLYGDAGSRTGKNGMYKQLDLLVDLFLDEVDYVGLPANQILHITRKYKKVVACEIDKDMFEFMRNVKARFAPDSNTSIYRENIFSYLERTAEKFSLYDLDLMQHLYDKDINKIVALISKTCKKRCIVNVASCIGRARSRQDYMSTVPRFFTKKFPQHRCYVIHHFSGNYSDRVTPMQYELFVIERGK